MHQPLEDYIPPPHVSYLGIIAGFVVMWMASTAMSDSAFIGFLVGCIVGAPAGLIGAWVLHYMSLAPIRADDKRRYQENQVRYKREAAERTASFRKRKEEQRLYTEKVQRIMDARMERKIAEGQMNYKLGKYLERKAEEAAKRAEAL
jgi:hypothetical protein